jgi:hypothetical protein
MLDAYKLGAQTLDSVLKSQNLTVERVDKTMDLVSDALASHKEIEEAISGGMVGDVGGVDEELEKELEKLMILEEEDDGRDRIDVVEDAPGVSDVPLVVAEVAKVEEAVNEGRVEEAVAA